MRQKICINKRILVTLTICILLLVAYTAINNAITKSRHIIQNKAADTKSMARAPLMRGSQDDAWADVILGKNRFEEVIPKEIVPFKLAGPAGAYVQQDNGNEHVYIYDGMNSRILGYKALGICSNSKAPCSTDLDCVGGDVQTCSILAGLDQGFEPDVVIGQEDAWNRGACNRDASFANYPERKRPTAASLCGMREDEQSYFEGGSAAGMASSKDGSLYFPDAFNHRILKYNDPIETDAIADDVWGQNNFVDMECNKGRNIDESTLCLVHGNFAKPAVNIDIFGNLWVADIGNNRILRFPYNSKTSTIAKKADLVLGQSSFTRNGSGTGPESFNAPNYVSSDSKGSIYVADYYNRRIVKFPYPQKSGMSGTILIADLDQPHSVEPMEQDKLLVSVKDKVNIYANNIEKPSTTLLLKQYPAMESYGSIGIFSDGTFIFTNSGGWQNVSYYKSNGALTKLFNTPEGELNGYDEHNYISNKGFHSLRGIAVTDRQIIVADAHRLSFWNANGPDDVNNGRPIDGFFGNDEGKLFSKQTYYRIAKGKKYLWALTMDNTDARYNSIQKYVLPVSQDQKPEEIIYMNKLKILGGGEIPPEKIMAPSDIYVDEENEYMWIALPWNDRVIRIRMPGEYFASYTIDAIVGGPSIPDRTPGWELKCDMHAAPNSLCYPGNLNEDKWGNLYISDMMVENAGSRNMYIFSRKTLGFGSDLLMLNVDDAEKKFTGTQTWKPSFNSQNVMVVGHYPFFTQNNERFPSVFNDILANTEFKSDGKIMDYYAQAFTMDFDLNDNLYIAELNRGSVYVYRKPFSYVNPSKPAKTAMIQPDNDSVCEKKGLAYFKACKKCGPSNAKLSEVCPSYCQQFDGNIEGCTLSQQRGYGCVWYGKCNMCLRDKGGGTFLPNPCPAKNETNAEVEGSITQTYKHQRPDSVVVEIQKNIVGGETWEKVKTLTVSKNPERDIPYNFKIDQTMVSLNEKEKYRFIAYALMSNQIAKPYKVTYASCPGVVSGDYCYMGKTGKLQIRLEVDGCKTLNKACEVCSDYDGDVGGCGLNGNCAYYLCVNRCINKGIDAKSVCPTPTPVVPTPSPTVDPASVAQASNVTVFQADINQNIALKAPVTQYMTNIYEKGHLQVTDGRWDTGYKLNSGDDHTPRQIIVSLKSVGRIAQLAFQATVNNYGNPIALSFSLSKDKNTWTRIYEANATSTITVSLKMLSTMDAGFIKFEWDKGASNSSIYLNEIVATSSEIKYSGFSFGCGTSQKNQSGACDSGCVGKSTCFNVGCYAWYDSEYLGTCAKCERVAGGAANWVMDKDKNYCRNIIYIRQ